MVPVVTGKVICLRKPDGQTILPKLDGTVDMEKHIEMNRCRTTVCWIFVGYNLTK